MGDKQKDELVKADRMSKINHVVAYKYRSELRDKIRQ